MTKSKVVFVCEHGAAKSVIAREYFNRLARERGLDVDAIARGTDPDAEIYPTIQRGLAGDGFTANLSTPRVLDAEDASSAMLIVSFDVDVVPILGDSVPNAKWDGLPPAKADYAGGKVAIVALVENLVDKMMRSERSSFEAS